jgi:glutamate-1-semialdehyde 2,1-aminomutase
VAAVIIWCNGLTAEFAPRVIEIAHRYGTLVIFDEVVTGFRYAPGGAQQFFGVKPDLTAMAKILAGGYPGGAVAGLTEVMRILEFRDDPEWLRFGRIAHPGTFNANPVSAAAGVACLEIVRDPAIQQRATATADAIRVGFREALQRHGIAGLADGWASMVTVKLDSKLPDRKLTARFKSAMQLEGVDPSGLQLIVSAVHTPGDVDHTVSAFDRALVRLRAEGAIR